MCVRPVVVVLAATAVLACSAPPDKERHQAEGALAAARAAGAAVYAPEQLEAAETALVAYEEAVAQGDYRQALHLALEARDHAHEAASRSGDEKALARSVAERLVAEAVSYMTDLQRRLERLPPADIQSVHAVRLRSLIAIGSDRLQEARTAFAAHDFRAVGRSLDPFLQELRAEVAAAEAGG